MKKSLIVNFVIFIVLFAISSVDAVAVNTSKLDIHFENIELLNGSVVAIIKCLLCTGK